MNDMPFEHVSINGTKFTCARCDFGAPIKVKTEFSLMEMADVEVLQRIMVDISEMIGYHSGNIWKELNGFQGYDCIQYELV
jgi:hypothetical protein